MLKERDKSRLRLLENYWQFNYVMPSYTELKTLLKLSRGGVSKFMHRMVREGYLAKHGRGFKPVILQKWQI
jgi:DNA-binding IclR family transcriptional regulator